MTQITPDKKDTFLFANGDQLVIGFGGWAISTQFLLTQLNIPTPRYETIDTTSITDPARQYTIGARVMSQIDLTLECVGQITMIEDFDPAEMQFEKGMFNKLSINEMFEIINQRLTRK